MTPVIIDASAGVELIVDSERGRALRRLLPDDAVPWVPDHFFAECGAVLRPWDLNGVLSGEQSQHGVDELLAWPLRVVCRPSPCLAAHLRRSPRQRPDARRAGVVLRLTKVLRSPAGSFCVSR